MNHLEKKRIIQGVSVICIENMSKVKCHTPLMDSALHVLKGAVVQVLQTPLTNSVVYRNAKQARLLVQYSGEAPTDAQVKEIERLANDIISQDVPVGLSSSCSPRPSSHRGGNSSGRSRTKS